jgi:hypothetical protein
MFFNSAAARRKGRGQQDEKIYAVLTYFINMNTAPKPPFRHTSENLKSP